MNHSIPSRVSATCIGSPEVSSTAFCAQPPNLRLASLIDMGFAIICPLPHAHASDPVLVHWLAHLLYASFRPRLPTTPLRFAITSPLSGCERDFHPPAVDHARHTNKKRRGVLAASLPLNVA